MTNPDILDALAKPPPPPSELDELMSRDPLDLAKDPTAIDKIIGYQRQVRAQREAGPKSRKRIDLIEHDNTKPIDLAALGLIKPQTITAPRPSTGGGFRRL